MSDNTTDSDVEKKQFISSDSEAVPNNINQFQKLLKLQIAPCMIPARYVLAIIGFFGFTIDYALRINLSMAIIDMDYGWSSVHEGWVLSAFFYGYIIPQIPGGYIASRYGGRYVLGIGILLTALLTLLTPLAAELHYSALMVLRFLEGICEGVVFPAMHALWGKWAPPKERSILAAVTFSGAVFGHVFGFFVTGIISQYVNWQSTFYIFGCTGIVWFIFWMYLAYSSPATHPRISEKERNYIETSIKKDYCKDEESNDEPTKTPWLSIMTSPAVWAIVIAHFSFNWGLFTLMTCVPSYFKDSLTLSFETNLLQNGAFSSIPYIANALVAVLSGQIADLLISSCGVSTVVVRKVFNTIGLLIAAAGLLAVGYFGSSLLEVVVYLTMSIGFSGTIAAGFFINHIDIAPQFAGILFGISNMVATIPGMLGPIVAKTIAHEPGPDQDYYVTYRNEWREVFMITAEIYIFGAMIYIIFGRGERQSWAGGEKEKKQNWRNWFTMKTFNRKNTSKKAANN